MARRPSSALRPTRAVRPSADRLPVVWRCTSEEPAERHAAARDVVSVITGNPQPSAAGPTVLAVDDGRNWSGAEPSHLDGIGGDKPISYQQLATAVAAIVDNGTGPPPTKHRPNRDTSHRSSFLQRKHGTSNVRVAARVHGEKKWVAVNAQQRDGVGGRKVTTSPYTPDAVLHVFHEMYGEPYVEQRLGPKRLTVWQVNPESRVADVLRLSSRELHGGETLRGQQFSIEALRANCGVAAPRFVVVATMQSSLTKYENRLDFRWLEDRIRAGQIETILSREPDRIGRDRTAVGLFYEVLREHHVQLYYQQYFGRKVNWEQDEFFLDMLHAFASVEGKTVFRRTHSATVRRYLLEGKGWPSSARFGMERDAKRYLVPVHKGMEVVNFIARRYNELTVAGDGGCRLVNEEVKRKFGIYVSDEKIRQILGDPIYTTGEWYVHYMGYRVACRPIELGHLAVPRRIYQENQELLSINGGWNSLTPKGEYLLNYRPFLHADCAGLENPPRLRAYNNKDRSGSAGPRPYHHSSKQPVPDGCRGLSVPSRLVETAVIDALRDIVRSPEIRQAFASAVLLRDKDHGHRDDAEILRQARVELARVEAERDLLRSHRAGQPGPFSDFTEHQWTLRWELNLDDLARAERALKDAEKRVKRGPAKVQPVTSPDETKFAAAVNALLTAEVPDDAAAKRARVALYKALVDRVVLHTPPEGWYLEIFGPLVPEAARQSGPLPPLAAAIDALRAAESSGALGLE